MEYLMDLHTHTLVSGHAYNTMREMVQAAADKGLKVLGITEHAPKMPGTCPHFYFHNLKILKRSMFGVELLLGAEVNILDYNGHVDLQNKEMSSLDVVIASMHSPCIRPGTKEENTRAYLKAMENPYINIIGHPDDGRFPVDYRALVEGAKERHVVLELNNHSLDPICMRANAWENDMEMLKWCMHFHQPIVVDSDAHADIYVGEFGFAKELLEEMSFPRELILNRDPEAIRPYMNKYQREETTETKHSIKGESE